MSRRLIWIGLASALTLAGCGQRPPPPPEIRPVRTVTVERRAVADTQKLTGVIRAQDEVNLAFRLDGRMIERKPQVGDKVTPGQEIASLDPQNQQNAARSAEAALSAAQGQFTQARNAFDRQQTLLGQGFTTRALYDQAQQALQSAQAQVEFDPGPAQFGARPARLHVAARRRRRRGHRHRGGARRSRSCRPDDRQDRPSGRARRGVRRAPARLPHRPRRSAGAA